MNRERGSFPAGVGQLSYLRHGWHGNHLGGTFADDHTGVRLVGGPSGNRQRSGQCPHRIATVVKPTTNRVAAVLLRVVAV